MKVKKRTPQKATNTQVPGRRRRKAKVETQRVPVDIQGCRVPMTGLEAALHDFDPVVRAIIIARNRIEKT
jgi:hypothetical protein